MTGYVGWSGSREHEAAAHSTPAGPGTDSERQEVVMVVDLAAFLTARLDEDEAAANAAAGPRWFLDSSEDYDERSVRYTGPSTLSPGRQADYSITDRVEESDAAHIARHDPARVLREVAAKRAILVEHRQGDNGSIWCWRCDPAADMEDSAAYYPCRTLRILAAVYSDHPDYDPAWK